MVLCASKRETYDRQLWSERHASSPVITPASTFRLKALSLWRILVADFCPGFLSTLPDGSG